ncbi:MAG: hypothetical protein AAF711_16535 [Planctomycetota bacterium]
MLLPERQAGVGRILVSAQLLSMLAVHYQRLKVEQSLCQNMQKQRSNGLHDLAGVLNADYDAAGF